MFLHLPFLKKLAASGGRNLRLQKGLTHAARLF